MPKYFKAWIIFFLIVTVGGFILGAFVGAILGIALHFGGVSPEATKFICAAAGFLLGVPLSYFTFRWCVSEFIVKQLAQPPAPASQPPPL